MKRFFVIALLGGCLFGCTSLHKISGPVKDNPPLLMIDYGLTITVNALQFELKTEEIEEETPEPTEEP